MGKSYKGYIISKKKSSGNVYLSYKPYKSSKIRSTGLLDTRENRKLVEKTLKEHYVNYLKKEGRLIGDREDGGTLISEYFDMFIIKSTNDGKSAGTIYKYKKSYRHIIGKHNYELFANMLKEDIFQFEDWYDNLIFKFSSKQGLSNSSKSTYISSLLVFVKWLKKYIPHDIKRPQKLRIRKNSVIQKFYTPEEMAMHQLYFQEKDPEFADYLLLLQYTGGRRTETVSLEKSSIDFKNGIITFPNKINSHQFDMFPITSKIKVILKRCIERADKEGRSHLFRWTKRRWVCEKIKRANIELGIYQKGRGLHAYRSSFANSLIDKELSPYEVKDLMRHRDIATTLDYYKSYNANRLREALER